MGQITARRGRVEGMEARGNAQVVRSRFHFQKCLVMQQHFVQVHKVVEYSLCTLITMKKFQNQFLKKLSKKIKVNN